MFELFAADQIPGLGEGRNPPAVLQHRVPADMIDMQMRADHGVDALARPAGIGQIREERRLQRHPAGHPARPVVAEAGIDNQPQARRVDQQGVDREAQRALLGDEVGVQPGHRPQRLGRRVAHERGRRVIERLESQARRSGMIVTRPTFQASMRTPPVRRV